MAGYHWRVVEFLLENYWLLKLGQIPQDEKGVMSKHQHAGRSPYETAVIWVSDLDKAIDRLDRQRPGRWLKVAAVITQSRLGKSAWRFSSRQQTIMRSYLVPYKYKYETPYRKWGTLMMLVRLMNGDKKKE